jgi:hypothetical protein
LLALKHLSKGYVFRGQGQNVDVYSSQLEQVKRKELSVVCTGNEPRDPSDLTTVACFSALKQPSEGLRCDTLGGLRMLLPGFLHMHHSP